MSDEKGQGAPESNASIASHGADHAAAVESATDHLLQSSVPAWTHAVEKLEKALAAGDKNS